MNTGANHQDFFSQSKSKGLADMEQGLWKGGGDRV
jgi:hypothetical protein